MKSITRAAEEKTFNPTAVSIRCEKLENLSALPLFERWGGQLHLRLQDMNS